MPSASAPAAARRLAEAEQIAGAIYTTHRGRLLALARRNCSNSDDAEEALQDAFVLFIDHFDPEAEASPLAWLTLTLKRRCWAIYGQRRRHARPIGGALEGQRGRDGGEPTPEDLAEVASEAAKLGERLRSLRPEERRALTLLALGYSYREICELTGWTYSKLNHCLAKGRARLRVE